MLIINKIFEATIMVEVDNIKVDVQEDEVEETDFKTNTIMIKIIDRVRMAENIPRLNSMDPCQLIGIVGLTVLEVDREDLRASSNLRNPRV